MIRLLSRSAKEQIELMEINRRLVAQVTSDQDAIAQLQKDLAEARQTLADQDREISAGKNIFQQYQDLVIKTASPDLLEGLSARSAS